jgi:hypothetical protein
LRKGTGADANASGAVRLAGSINFKEKYAPNFPRVQLIHAGPGLITSREQLESLGVVAAREPADDAKPAAMVIAVRPVKRGWPSYQRCVDGAPQNGDGTGADRSRADFTWCIIAIDWGWPVGKVAARLMMESSKAQENGGEYARRTAANAAKAVERRRRARDARSQACTE